jgi:hypothetical protein
MIKRPNSTDYPEFFNTYIDLVKGDNVLKELEKQILEMQFILSDVPEEREDYTYATGKWTLKEVIGHIIDTERVMTYRALSFARCNPNPQPGFDPDMFMKNVNFNKRTLYDLAHEFGIVRESTILLYKNLSAEDLDKVGVANNWKMTVRSAAYVNVGHATHHLNFIKAKYLI